MHFIFLILRVQCADYTTCATSVGQDTVCYSNFKACGEVQAILLRQRAGGFFGKASKAWSGVTAHWPLTINPSKPWPYAGIFTHGYQVCLLWIQHGTLHSFLLPLLASSDWKLLTFSKYFTFVLREVQTDAFCTGCVVADVVIVVQYKFA
jgi:hypothetical protein